MSILHFFTALEKHFERAKPGAFRKGKKSGRVLTAASLNLFFKEFTNKLFNSFLFHPYGINLLDALRR
jgi:hypothetical protein